MNGKHVGCFKFNRCRELHTTTDPHASVRKVFRRSLKIIFDLQNNEIQQNITFIPTIF